MKVYTETDNSNCGIFFSDLDDGSSSSNSDCVIVPSISNSSCEIIYLDLSRNGFPPERAECMQDIQESAHKRSVIKSWFIPYVIVIFALLSMLKDRFYSSIRKSQKQSLIVKRKGIIKNTGEKI